MAFLKAFLKITAPLCLCVVLSLATCYGQAIKDAYDKAEEFATQGKFQEARL